MAVCSEYGQPPMVDDKPYTHPPPASKCPPCKNGYCNEPSDHCTCFTSQVPSPIYDYMKSRTFSNVADWFPRSIS